MHRSTRACAISREVRKRVYERDNEGLCIICGRSGLPEAHVIPRSALGLGIEENIVTLCRDCHRLYDGVKRQEYGEIIRNYMRTQYPDWDNIKKTYQKGD